MRVLVTGVKGQLGYDVMNELAARGIEGIGVDVEEMDITDASACERVITEAKADAVAQMVLGSGVMIKNSLGAAAVVILALLTLVPVLKLLLLMLLYQSVAAVMQPVCDKRMVSCVAGVSRGHKLLLQVVLYSLLLFIIAIAVTCASTNVNYFAS